MSLLDDTTRLPWHLRGNFAPVQEEVTAFDLPVTGAIPVELDGLYVRNGANPKSGWSPHWFFGNGMLHGVRISGGRAQWYRNRYVQTPLLDDAATPRMSPEGVFNRVVSAANTHVIGHAGRILALEEGAFPWVVGPELETVGPLDFDGRLTTAFTAHPKICPETGELLAFGYGQLQPYLTYLRVSAAGELVQSTEITVKGPTMMHDFNATRNHVVFMDLPVVFDLDLALRGQMPMRWDDDYGARLGVMPRNGTDADVRWFEVDPCYVFHPVNAYEEITATGSTRLVLDVCRYPQMWRQGWGDDVATLHRWTVDLGTGRVGEQPLDDRPVEFGRVADADVARSYRYGYATSTSRPGGDDEERFATSLVRYDLTTGATEVHECGPGRRPGEAAPAAVAGTGDGEGYAMTYVYDESTGGSELVIIDTSSFSSAPVARIAIPQRVPFGFHGSWIPS